MSKSACRATSIPSMKVWSCIEAAHWNVDAELSFRVIQFSFTRNRILLSTSISHVSARMVLPSTSLPLVLVLSVARILTHSAPLVCF